MFVATRMINAAIGILNVAIRTGNASTKMTNAVIRMVSVAMGMINAAIRMASAAMGMISVAIGRLWLLIIESTRLVFLPCPNSFALPLKDIGRIL